MNETTERSREGLKDLSKWNVDVPKSHWNSVMAQMEAEEAAAKAAATAAGAEPGSYDATAVSYMKYSVMPLRPAEIAELMQRLGKLSYVESGKLIDHALQEAQDTLHGVEIIDELPNDVYDLHKLHDMLEEALYIAEEPEEYAVIVRWLAVVHLLLPEYEDYAIGRVGITVFCLDSYFDEGFDESAAHAAEAVEVAKTLRTWAFTLLGRIDTIRLRIPERDYICLVDYYERLTIDLGKQTQYFAQYVCGEEPHGVVSPDWAKKILEQVRDTAEFAKEIESGKYDAWELECMANAAAELFRSRSDKDEKADAAEMLLLTDKQYGHYISRHAADYSTLLQSSGAVDSNGKAKGVFIGNLGRTIHDLQNTAGKKIKIPPKSDFYRGIIAALFCLAVAAYTLIADPETTEWLWEGGLILAGIFSGVALFSGLVAGGFAGAIMFVGVAWVVFMAVVCLLSLLGNHGGIGLNRCAVLAPALANVFLSLCIAAAASPRKIKEACAEKEAQDTLLRHGMDKVSGCVRLLFQKAQHNLPTGIGFYYLEMSDILKQIEKQLPGEYDE